MESMRNQMTDCRIKRIKKISNAFYNSSVIMAILSMIVYYCCDMEKNNIIIMKTVVLAFYILTVIVCLVCDVLIINKDAINKKGSSTYKLCILQKVTKSFSGIFILISYLLYDFHYDYLFFAFILMGVFLAIASFVFWYEYKAKLSKDANDSIVI